MALSTLRIRVSHIALAVGGVVALGVGALAWRAMRPDPQRDQVSEGLERVRGKQSANTPKFARGMFSGAPAEAENVGEGVAVFAPPLVADPGDLGPAEAVDSFQEVITELEAALDSGRRLSKRERDQLYNRATGSFTALSAWVDPQSPSERAMMNDAYAQMTALMRELGIRPPAHDPDYKPEPSRM